MTSPSLPAKAQAGLYALLGFALISSLSFLLDSIKYYRTNSDALSGSLGYMARYDELRKELPMSGKVGFWTSPEDSGDLEFHLTQFAVAPTVLEKSTNYPLVVGSSSAKAPKPEELQARGLALAKDFGMGVVLYRRVR